MYYVGPDTAADHIPNPWHHTTHHGCLWIPNLHTIDLQTCCSRDTPVGCSSDIIQMQQGTQMHTDGPGLVAGKPCVHIVYICCNVLILATLELASKTASEEL